MSVRPLVIIGLDGAAPERLLDRAQRGELPVLGSLVDRGGHARLAGPEILGPHGSWLTIFSGRSPAEHGLYARTLLVPGTYTTRRYDPATSSVRPFWSQLQEHHGRILILDAPETAPVAGLDGFQLSGWGTHEGQRHPRSEPSQFADEVCRRYGGPIRSSEGQRGRWWDRWVLRRLHQRVERKGRLVRDLLGEQGPFSLVVVVFGASHAAAHRYATWQGRDARTARMALAIEETIDSEIGGIVAAAGSDADIVVISNVGIRDGYPTRALTRGFCRQLGYQEGPIDSGRMQLFPLPSTYTGFLRVNLQGREPLGLVEPGSEYASLLDRVERDLRALVWEGSGTPAVESVLRTADAFGGEPPSLLPDLVVEWSSAERSSRVLHPQAVLERPLRGSPRGNHHSRSGLVIFAGGEFEESGDLGELRPVTLAERFLQIVG